MPRPARRPKPDAGESPKVRQFKGRCRALFAAAPSDKIQKAATAVIAAPYASPEQGRAAFDAAIEGLMEEVDDEQKVNAERLLQTTQRRLDVFSRVLDAAARFGSSLQTPI